MTLSGDVELADVMRMAATGRDLASGGVIRGVHIEGFTAGVNRVKVYDLTLANVAVTEWCVDSEDPTTACPSTTARSPWSPTASMAAGKPSQNGEFGYDVTNNTEIAPFSLGLSSASSSRRRRRSKYFLALDGVRGDLDPSFKGPGASA